MNNNDKSEKNSALFGNCILSLIIIILMMLLILNKQEFIFQVNNGTGIVNGITESEYSFTPDLESTTDILVQQFVPRYSYLESIDIRLANENPVLVDCILSFSIEQNGERIWTQDAYSDQIENWRYYNLELDVEIEKGETYFFVVECKDNRGGVPFKVFLCNTKLEENIALKFNDEILNGNMDLIYEYQVFPIFKFVIMMGILISSFIYIWYIKSIKIKLSLPVIVTILSVLYLYILETLSYNTLLNMSMISIIINVSMIIAFIYLVLVVSNSIIYAGIICGLFIIVLGVVNHFTLKFRGAVLLPADIYSINTAYDVLHNYNLEIDRSILESLFLFYVLIFILLKIIVSTNRNRRKNLAIVLLISMFVNGITQNEALVNRLDIQVKQDNQSGRSKEIGFLLNFFENIKYFIISKPEGYSHEIVNRIYDSNDRNSIKFNQNISELQPNILVIMNESFTDLSLLGDLDVSEDYMNNFYSISKEDNAKSGKCVVSVYGGGTSCSEFEFLTGSTMLFLGSGIAPYQQYVHFQLDALPSYLVNKGYDSYAIHGANPKSWNREEAYPLIGFEEFISEESEEFWDVSKCRFWISDKSMLDVMYDKVNTNEDRKFGFALTIQCHGGYDYEEYESKIEVLNMSETYEDVNQYLTLLQDTDNAFGSLIDCIKKLNKPTIVLMFGDHLPSLNNTFYEELIGKKQEEYTNNERFLKYTTPYIIWANYDIDLSVIPDMLSVNFLAAHILKVAGIELDDYYSYLYSLSKKYPVISRSGIMDIYGNVYDYTVDSECYKDVMEYEILQYNHLFD